MANLSAKRSVLKGAGKIFTGRVSVQPWFGEPAAYFYTGGRQGAISPSTIEKQVGADLFQLLMDEVRSWPEWSELENKEINLPIETGAAGFMIKGKLQTRGMGAMKAVFHRAITAEKNIGKFNALAQTAFTEILVDLTREIRAMARDVVTTRVYNTPVRTSRSKTQAIMSQPFYLQHERTNQLLRAAVYGIYVEGNSIVVGIDENMAPYWMFVEYGHRVVLPGGIETGTWVFPRPFYDEIKKKSKTIINKYMKDTTVRVSQIGKVIHSYIKGKRGGGTAFIAKYPISSGFATAWAEVNF